MQTLAAFLSVAAFSSFQLTDDSEEAVKSLPVLTLEDVQQVSLSLALYSNTVHTRASVCDQLAVASHRLCLWPVCAARQTDNEIPYAVRTIEGVPLITHELPSSGIAYCEVMLSIADLELQDIALLRLFNRLLTEAGTSDLSAVELQHLIGRTTGGLSAATDVRSISAVPRTVADPFSSVGFVVLSGKVSKRLLAVFHSRQTQLQGCR